MSGISELLANTLGEIEFPNKEELIFTMMGGDIEFCGSSRGEIERFGLVLNRFGEPLVTLPTIIGFKTSHERQYTPIGWL